MFLLAPHKVLHLLPLLLLLLVMLLLLQCPFVPPPSLSPEANLHRSHCSVALSAAPPHQLLASVL
jgi:hypothetical protein